MGKDGENWYRKWWHLKTRIFQQSRGFLLHKEFRTETCLLHFADSVVGTLLVVTLLRWLGASAPLVCRAVFLVMV